MAVATSPQTEPAGILPGQRMMHGSLMPPSHVVPFVPRRGALLPPSLAARDPLSLVNITSVFSSRPRLRSSWSRASAAQSTQATAPP